MAKHAGRFLQIGISVLREEPYERADVERFIQLYPHIQDAFLTVLKRDAFHLRRSPEEKCFDAEVAAALEAVRLRKRQGLAMNEAARTLRDCLDAAEDLASDSMRFEVELLSALVEHFSGSSRKACRLIDELGGATRRGERNLDLSPDELRRRCITKAARGRLAYDQGELAEYRIHARIAWEHAEVCPLGRLRIRVRDLFAHASRSQGEDAFGDCLMQLVPDIVSAGEPRETPLERLMWECIEPY